MSRIFTLALAASAALCLAACATGGPTAAQVDAGLTTAETGFLAAQSVVQSDAAAGLIDAATAKQIDGYISAATTALTAAQAAYAAHDATTEQAKVAAVMTAVTQINTAVILAVQAHNGG